jgi:tetratricopeptide (TPR) repeat protein
VYVSAEREYRAAIKDLDAISGTGEILEYQEQMARCGSNLGLVLVALGRHVEGEGEHKQAISKYQQLVHRAAPQYALGLIDARLMLAQLEADTGKAKDACDTDRRAVEECRLLIAANGHLPEYRRTMGRAANHLGIILSQLSRPEESLAFLNEAVEQREILLTEDPNREDYRVELGNTVLQRCLVLRSLNRVMEIATATEKLVHLTKDSPEDFYNAACLLAWSAEKVNSKNHELAQRWMVRAIDLLELSLSLDPRNARLLHEDQDLKPLEPEPRFRRLKEQYP